LNTVRRNFQLGVANGVLFTLGETLLDTTLVLAVFISRLTPSPIWLGLLTPLRDGGWFLPQLWVSGFLQSWPRKIRLYRWVSVVRAVSWITMTLAVFFFRDPLWTLVAFLIPFSISSLASGFSGLPFMEIIGKTVPPRQRGLFFAWRLALGGAASIGGSLLVRWLLSDDSPLQFPYTFGALFAIATVFMCLGLVAFSLIDEPEDAHPPPPASFGEQFRHSLAVFQRDDNFRHFLYLRSALMIAGSATPFLAVYVQKNLGGAVEMVGVYLATFSAANLIANVLFGRFSARLGNRHTMTLAAVAGLVMTTLALALILLAAPLGLYGLAASLWLLPVFVLFAIRESGLGVAAQSLLLDIAPREDRTIYLGFTNSLLGIVFLATGFSGVVVNRFGYPTLLIITVIAHLVGLNSALRMKSVL
jgi:hypothetical protein